MDNNYLYHYGIKGMKWGVRKDRVKSGSRRNRKDSWSEDARTVNELKKKKKNQLSNAEMRKVNERLQLEQNYNRLNPNTVQKGMKVVAATAAAMGTAMNLYNNSDKIISLGKKVSDRLVDMAGDYVVNNIKW